MSFEIEPAAGLGRLIEAAKRVRRAGQRGLIFVVLLVLGAWPSVPVREVASTVLATVISTGLSRSEFGQGGRAKVLPASVSEVRRAGENMSADAELRLSIDGRSDESINAVNLRRDVYLPLLIFVAAVICAPVSLGHRALALALGLPWLFAASLGAFYLTASYLFAHLAPAVYPLSPAGLRWLDAAVGVLLMPPALRFFVPLAIAALSLLVARGRDAASS